MIRLPATPLDAARLETGRLETAHLDAKLLETADVSSAAADGGGSRTADAGASQGSASPSPPTGVAALLRLAVVSIDADGRISHWNRGAEELFGHRWESVFGQRTPGLLSTAAPETGTAQSGSRQDVFDMLDDLTQPCWTGEFQVVGRGGMEREALWWSYRIVEGAGRGLLVLAVNAKPLRAGGLRIAIGDRMLPYELVGAVGADAVRITPRLGPASGAADDPAALTGAAPDPAALAVRLGAVLPRVSPGRLERIMRQVTRLGYPAIEVEGTAPLPVLPYEAVRPYGTGEPSASENPAAPGSGTAVRRRPARRQPELLPPPQPGSRTASATSSGRPTGAGATADPAAAAQIPAPARAPSTGRARGGRTPKVVTPTTVTPSGGAQPVTGDLQPADVSRGVPVHLAPVQDFPPTSPGHVVQQQLALLRETGTRVGTTLQLETTASELCRVAVPRFADFTTVLIVDDVFTGAGDAGQDSRLGHRTPLTMRRIAVSGRHSGVPWDTVLPEGELFSLRSGHLRGLTEPLLLPVVDPSVADDVAADLGVPAAGPLLARRSLLITPLTARGTVLGRMCFIREPQRRPFNAKDTATAVEFAARGAVHLDNARLHQFEARAATTLQRSMLPTSPPRLPGVSIAHHYRPGDRQAQVGGDWFDAIQLPGGRVALIVGDVMGHGLLSAAVMGQFRTAVQTMAALDLPPAQLLRHLDNLAHKLGADHLATCVYAVYDPIHRTLNLANAGHIPPVLARHDGRSELLEIPEGAPIGVGGVPFETVEIPVPDGSWLVLCTDGLVEVRGQGIDAGLAALCANVIEPQQTPEDVCNQILSRVHSEDRRDDVALLVARFDGIAPQDVAEWRFTMDPSEVRVARAVTRERLTAWGLGQLADRAELLVSELVTNALRVANQEVRLRLMRVGKLLVEVSDDDHNLPQLRRADQDDENGRGLALVSNLSQRWGTNRKAVGKVVWFELPLPKG